MICCFTINHFVTFFRIAMYCFTEIKLLNKKTCNLISYKNLNCQPSLEHQDCWYGYFWPEVCLRSSISITTYPSSAWSLPPSLADPEPGRWCRWSSTWRCRPGLRWSGCSGQSCRWRWINHRTEGPPAECCPAPPRRRPSPPPAPAEPPSPPACPRPWTWTRTPHSVLKEHLWDLVSMYYSKQTVFSQYC